MTHDAYTHEGRIPHQGTASQAARTALKRAALSLSAGIVGAYGLGAVITYSPEDPSFNVATDGPTHNIFGGPGAAFADLAIQTLGAGAPLAMGALFAAGAMRVYRRRLANPIDRGKLMGGVAGISLLSAAASTIPTPEGWPLAAGFGGVMGDTLGGVVNAMLSAPGLPFPHVLAGLVCAAGGVLACGWAFTVKAKHVAAAGRVAAHASGAATRAITYVAQKNRQDEPDSWNLPRKPLEHQRNAAQQQPQARQRQAEPLPQAQQADFDRPSRPIPQAMYAAPEPAAEPAPRRQQRQAPPQNTKPAQQTAYSFGRPFELPGGALLAAAKPRTTQADANTLHEMSRQLETVLQDFGVQGEIISARPGPVVTLFEFEPAAGVKSSRVIGLADDIARSMSANAARVAVIPGRNAIGIELPNMRRETVYLRTLLGSNAFLGTQGRLPLALGETIEGDPYAADLSRMPHLLIAGTTGSGKSVGINAMILSLLYRHPPEDCRFIMIDPKMLELSVYEGIPHLLSPVVTDPKKAVVALKWTVREMEDRYRRMSKLGVRNIDGYNERVRDALAKGERLERTVHAGFDPTSGEPIYETRELPLEPMPYIVVVIDEMADLMIVAGKEIEAAVQRLAQMARAAGIHLIMATQRPSVDVITGTIKANFPTRISYQVTSKIDSRTILGEQGAEQLLGQGDLLFMEGGGRVRRLHGPFVTDAEVERVVEMLKAQGSPQYLSQITEEEQPQSDYDEPELFGDGEGGGDDLMSRAIEIVRRDRKASTSYLQRRLQIGYNRAATLVERLEKEGVISTANAAGKREILIGQGVED
ncbi:MAG: DNA translocase FtsK [Caulobacterales bacterium]